MIAATHSSPALFRQQFPTLSSKAYLASCSLAAPSLAVQEALERMLTAMRGRAPWSDFETEVDTARQGFAALIGTSPQQIALVPSVSVGAYQVASLLRWAGGRPRVLVSTAEWPGMAHVWQAQLARGAQVDWIDTAPDRPPFDDYRAALDERVNAVSVPLVDYRDGVRYPIAELTAAAHDAGAVVVVDASHAVGVQPVDVTQLGCDYLIATTSKYMLGLPGLAFVYVRDPESGRKPTLTGWLGRINPQAFDPRLDWPGHAGRLETGTPAIPSVYAANAGMALLAGLDLAAVSDHVLDLTCRAARRLQTAGEYVVLPPAEARGAHIAMHDQHPQDLARWLADRDIVVAPRGSKVRVAVHYFTTDTDVDSLCDAVGDYRRRPRSADGRLS